MDIRTDSTTKDNASPQVAPEPTKHRLIGQRQRFALLSELLIVLGLTLTALLPRTLLAMRLDMVTDEVVYILGGKIYLPLLMHLSIGSKGWSYNYEHPPLVKLLIGLALSLNVSSGHPLGELFVARLPSVLFGTLLIVAIYWLGRAPFGRVVALTAALCLAVSPWLVYFSALAYLDMTMTALVTIAYLLTWHAVRQPWLYLLAAILIGLGADSKYTAVLAIPGMVLFTAYYFLLVRPRLPVEERPRVPWLEWLTSLLAAPATFYSADPAIWPHPLSLLLHSFRYEWNHSHSGHLTFIAGQYSLHVPHWAILYIILAKMSAFVTVSAACFVVFALVQLVRFHFGTSRIAATDVASISFLLLWLLSMLGAFSLLNIVVGTHYHLPLAPPVALAGASGLAVLLRYRRGMLFITSSSFQTVQARATHIAPAEPPLATGTPRTMRINPRAAIIVALLAIVLVGPHLIGLTTVYAAEGYSSEFFQGENTVLQVAYPGYREAVQWLAASTYEPARVGLTAIPGTLNSGGDGVSWYDYNRDLPGRFQLLEAHPDDRQFSYDYLVWPMHLVQRGYAIPEPWRSHVVHIIMGGNTIYCYIMARVTLAQNLPLREGDTS